MDVSNFIHLHVRTHRQNHEKVVMSRSCCCISWRVVSIDYVENILTLYADAYTVEFDGKKILVCSNSFIDRVYEHQMAI